MMDIGTESSGNDKLIFPTLPEIPCLSPENEKEQAVEVDHDRGGGGAGQKVPGMFMILYWIIMLLITFVWLFWSLFLKKQWHNYHCHQQQQQ